MRKKCKVARLGKHDMYFVETNTALQYEFRCSWCGDACYVPFRKFWKGKTWWQKFRKELAYQFWRRW